MGVGSYEDRSGGRLTFVLAMEKIMSNPMRTGLYLIGGGIALIVLIKLAAGLFAFLGGLLNLLIPLAIIGGIGLLLYGAINRKSLGGGRRYLP